MENIEIRAVIKYFHLKGLTPKEIIEDFQKTLGGSAPSNATVYNWINEFKRGRTSTFDEPRSGRPKEVTTPEMIDKIHDMVLADRKLKVREIAEDMGISTERVLNILRDECGMKKLCSRWVPRILTPEQKRNRVVTSKQCLDKMKHNPTDFFRRIITVDETWIHHYTPESREQAKEWRERGEIPPKRPKGGKSAGKVLASVFWDTQGIIFIDYLEHGRTITGPYYITLLERLVQELKKKRPRLYRKRILFLQDNAPAHKCKISMEKFEELGFELLPHPAYSPDLAPSDYYLFPNLKRWLCGKRFENNEEVEFETDGYFGRLQPEYYLKGIRKLEDRWNRCILLKGDYVEN